MHVCPSVYTHVLSIFVPVSIYLMGLHICIVPALFSASLLNDRLNSKRKLTCMHKDAPLAVQI